MGASILRSAARHRPAVDALLCSAATDTSAALVRPAPAARRQLYDSAAAKTTASEVERVEEAAAARYGATGRFVQQLTGKVKKLTATLHKKEIDAALDLTRTSAKVCALVSLSAVTLGGFSYMVISPPSSAPPAAIEEVDKGMEEVKTRLQGKISEWYEDEEAKAVSKSKSVSVSKLKSVSVSKPKSKDAATKSVPGSSSDSKTASGSGSGSKTGSASASDSKIGSGSDSVPKTGSGSASDPKTGSGSASDPKTGSGSASDPKTGSASDSKTGSKTGSDPKTDSGSDSNIGSGSVAVDDKP